MKNRETEKKM